MFALQTFLFGLVFFVPWTLSSHFNRTIMRNGFLARANVPTRNLIAPLENDGTFVALQDKLNSEFGKFPFCFSPFFGLINDFIIFRSTF